MSIFTAVSDDVRKTRVIVAGVVASLAILFSGLVLPALHNAENNANKKVAAIEVCAKLTGPTAQLACITNVLSGT